MVFSFGLMIEFANENIGIYHWIPIIIHSIYLFFLILSKFRFYIPMAFFCLFLSIFQIGLLFEYLFYQLILLMAFCIAVQFSWLSDF